MGVLIRDQKVNNIDIEFDDASLNHVNLVSVVALLVKGVALQQLEWLQFRHNGEQELMLLVLEEVDAIDDFSVGALDDLVSQLLGQLVEEIFLGCEAVVRPLVVLYVALDAVVHGHGHGCSQPEVF